MRRVQLSLFSIFYCVRLIFVSIVCSFCEDPQEDVWSDREDESVRHKKEIQYSRNNQDENYIWEIMDYN